MNILLYTLIATVYLASGILIAVYTVPEYLANREIDSEGIARHAEGAYRLVQTRSDHFWFYCNIFVPVWNTFCALLIVAISSFDGFFDWLFDLMLNVESDYLLADQLRANQPRVDKWTTSI